MGEEYLPWPYPRGRGGGDVLTLFLRGFAWLLAVMLKIFLIYVASRGAENGFSRGDEEKEMF